MSAAAQQPPDLGDLPLAPYEAAQLKRQVVGGRFFFGRSTLGKATREPAFSFEGF